MPWLQQAPLIGWVQLYLQPWRISAPLSPTFYITLRIQFCINDVCCLLAMTDESLYMFNRVGRKWCFGECTIVRNANYGFCTFCTCSIERTIVPFCTLRSSMSVPYFTIMHQIFSNPQNNNFNQYVESHTF